RAHWSEFIPFLAFPPEVRRVIYTTNLIESMNARLRKVTRNRGQFPSEQAALKVLYLAIRNLEEFRSPTTGIRTSGGKQALQAFTGYFEGRTPTPKKPPQSLTQTAGRSRGMRLAWRRPVGLLARSWVASDLGMRVSRPDRRSAPVTCLVHAAACCRLMVAPWARSWRTQRIRVAAASGWSPNSCAIRPAQPPMPNCCTARLMGAATMSAVAACY